MKKSTKLPLILLIIILIIAITGYLLSIFLENKLQAELESALEENHFTYDELSVSVWDRSASLEKAEYIFKGKSFEAKKLKLNNIDVLTYFQEGDIVIGELHLDNPKFKVFAETPDEEEEDLQEEFEENILVKKIFVNNGNLQFKETDTAKNQLYLEFSSLEVQDWKLNSKSLQGTIPFTYNSYKYQGDSLFIRLNKEHYLNVGPVQLNNGSGNLTRLQLRSFFSRAEFQRQIPYEKDHFYADIDSIQIKQLDWQVENDSLILKNPLTEIFSANLKVYRDKLQPDDTRQKPMYSQMIRELPVKVKFDTIRLRNTSILYEERMHEDREPGEIEFKQLAASVYNFTNIGMDTQDFPQTRVDVQTRFMGQAPLKVNWSFDVRNTADYFNISGNMGTIGYEQMNRFMKPAMNVETKGNIDSMEFDFSGNRNEAEGEMKLVYKDFKVEVLRSDGSRKNKVLSALANLILNNDAETGDAARDNIRVTRDKTKSFWNYFWLCIREGALKNFI